LVIATLGVGIASPNAAGATPTTTTAPTTVSPTTAATGDNDHLFTVGEVVVPPGVPHEVEIVLTRPDDTGMSMVVRNGTADTLNNLEVTGVARDDAGTVVAWGSTQDFQPAIVEPGEWAMGYAWFELHALSGDETFDWNIEWDIYPNPNFTDVLELTVTEAEYVLEDMGQFVVGTATNENDETAMGSNAAVGCFDGPDLLGVRSASTNSRAVSPGESSPFDVWLYDFDTCPAFAVAASGYNP
jgi:hypothetical protein